MMLLHRKDFFKAAAVTEITHTCIHLPECMHTHTPHTRIYIYIIEHWIARERDEQPREDLLMTMAELRKMASAWI